MQEKEEKLLKIYENQQQKAFEKVGRSSAGSSSSNTSIGSTGGGKVSFQFFFYATNSNQMYCLGQANV